MVEQLLSAKDLAWRRGEKVEEIKLLGGHLDPPFVQGDLSGLRVDVEISIGKRGGVVPSRLRAPQYRFDTCRQLPGGEWFDDVVVSPHPQSGNAIDLMASPGEKDHGDVARPPESLEYVATVLVGQTNVQQDKIWLMTADGVKRRGAAACDIDPVPFGSKQPRQELTEIKVVVDDQ
jgi:hypothetical protein